MVTAVSSSGTTERPAQRAAALVDRRLLGAGLVVWTIIGLVLVAMFVLSILAAISEIVLPLVFAVMLGTVAYPIARWLQQHRMRPSFAALLTELVLVLTGVAVAVLAVRAIIRQTGEMNLYVDEALAEAAESGDSVGLDAAALEHLRDSLASMSWLIGRGLVTVVLDGVGAVIGFVGSLILSLLLMYYVLKDGPEIRRWLVKQSPARMQGELSDFLATAVRALRAYWGGRSVISAVVTVVIVVVSLLMGLPLIATIAVVNFFGGFVPYIGAFIGGGLATLVALADGGIAQGLLMLGVVLTANLLLENVLEPRIMSGRLDIHPLMVLIATTIGGVVGGLVGLVLAVPVTVVGLDLVRRIRTLYSGAVPGYEK